MQQRQSNKRVNIVAFNVHLRADKMKKNRFAKDERLWMKCLVASDRQASGSRSVLRSLIRSITKLAMVNSARNVHLMNEQLYEINNKVSRPYGPPVFVWAGPYEMAFRAFQKSKKGCSGLFSAVVGTLSGVSRVVAIHPPIHSIPQPWVQQSFGPALALWRDEFHPQPQPI